MRNRNFLKSCVIEIRVKRIRINQGVGVYKFDDKRTLYNYLEVLVILQAADVSISLAIQFTYATYLLKKICEKMLLNIESNVNCFQLFILFKW